MLAEVVATLLLQRPVVELVLASVLLAMLSGLVPPEKLLAL